MLPNNSSDYFTEHSFIINEHELVYAFVEIHVGENPHIIDNNI